MTDASTPLNLDLTKIAIGLAGATVSLKFVQGRWWERLGLVDGGAALSYFGTTPCAQLVGVKDAEGLLGFLIGLFGMGLVTKVYESLQAVDAQSIARAAWAWRTAPVTGLPSYWTGNSSVSPLPGPGSNQKPDARIAA